MNQRIKEIRKSTGLTQDEFAKRLNLSRNFIAQIEIGAREPSDRTISDICREFKANEEWLRTGTGSMYAPKSEEAQIAGVLSAFTDAPPGSFINRFACALSKLDESDWEDIARIVEKMAQK